MAGDLPLCQVDGCNADLSEYKEYYRRHRVCEMHAKAVQVSLGNEIQRFCQQCSRFHMLDSFDEGRRSCRRRLLGHNKRRRKQTAGGEAWPASDTDGTTMRGSQGGNQEDGGAAQGAAMDNKRLCLPSAQRGPAGEEAALREGLERMEGRGGGETRKFYQSSQPSAELLRHTSGGSYQNLIPKLTAAELALLLPHRMSSSLQAGTSSPAQQSFQQPVSSLLLRQAAQLQAAAQAVAQVGSVAARSLTAGALLGLRPSGEATAGYPPLSRGSAPADIPPLPPRPGSGDLGTLQDRQGSGEHSSSGDHKGSNANRDGGDLGGARGLSPLKSAGEPGQAQGWPKQERPAGTAPASLGLSLATAHPPAESPTTKLSLRHAGEGASSEGRSPPAKADAREPWLGLGPGLEQGREQGSTQGDSDQSQARALLPGSEPQKEVQPSRRAPGPPSYHSQERTGRILFKLLDRNPLELPSDLPNQVMKWLAHSPSAIETYLRPGCTLLAIIVRMPALDWTKTEETLQGSLERLVGGPGSSSFWSQGAILVQVHRAMAFIRDGKVEEVPTASFRTAPSVTSVRPFCTVAGEPTLLTLTGNGLSHLDAQVVCSYEGHLQAKACCQSGMQPAEGTKAGQASNPRSAGQESSQEETRFLLPALRSDACGRVMLEVEHMIGPCSSDVWPVIVADKDICSEICSLEAYLEPGGPSGVAADGDPHASVVVLSVLHDLGWALEELRCLRAKGAHQEPHGREPNGALQGGHAGRPASEGGEPIRSSADDHEGVAVEMDGTRNGAKVASRGPGRDESEIHQWWSGTGEGGREGAGAVGLDAGRNSDRAGACGAGGEALTGANKGSEEAFVDRKLSHLPDSAWKALIAFAVARGWWATTKVLLRCAQERGAELV